MNRQPANIKLRVKGWSISNGSGEKLQKLPDPLALVMLLLAASLVYQAASLRGRPRFFGAASFASPSTRSVSEAMTSDW